MRLRGQHALGCDGPRDCAPPLSPQAAPSDAPSTRKRGDTSWDSCGLRRGSEAESAGPRRALW